MHLILDMPEGMVQQTLIYVFAFYVHLDGNFFYPYDVLFTAQKKRDML